MLHIYAYTMLAPYSYLCRRSASVLPHRWWFNWKRDARTIPQRPSRSHWPNAVIIMKFCIQTPPSENTTLLSIRCKRKQPSTLMAPAVVVWTATPPLYLRTSSCCLLAPAQVQLLLKSQPKTFAQQAHISLSVGHMTSSFLLVPCLSMILSLSNLNQLVCCIRIDNINEC